MGEGGSKKGEEGEEGEGGESDMQESIAPEWQQISQ